MNTKTKIVLAALIVIGTAASAMANDQTDERGGFVVPGSTDGVNPAYHPDLFGAWALGRTTKPTTILEDRYSGSKPGHSR